MWRELYLQALRGEAELPPAYQIFRWFVRPHQQAFPTFNELKGVQDAQERSALAYRCVLGALLSGHVDELDLFAHSIVDPAYRELAAGWRNYFDGRRVSLEAAKAASEVPDVRIHAQALLALDAIETGDLVQARQFARIATRMAKTEEAPQEQYLAAWTLARTRRYSGTPHLSTRILQSLGRFRSPAWRGVVGWERAINGDAQAESRAGSVGPWADAIQAWIDSGADFATAPKLPAPLAKERVLAQQAVDALAETSGPAADWLCGTESIVPAGLSGLSRDPKGSAVWVYSNGERGRRFIAHHGRLAKGVAVIQGPPRALHAIAALMLEPSLQMETSALFREIYGFEYEPALHKAAFKVLRHRVRGAIQPVGAFMHEAGVLSLRLDTPSAVPDPRSGTTLSEQVLRVLACSDRADAKSTSRALGVPLRTVQRTLQELVNGGDCVATKVGRYAAYRIEDTTFSDPSIRWRDTPSHSPSKSGQ